MNSSNDNYSINHINSSENSYSINCCNNSYSIDSSSDSWRIHNSNENCVLLSFCLTSQKTQQYAQKRVRAHNATPHVARYPYAG